MRIALVQQQAGPDKVRNIQLAFMLVREAARQGAKLACFAELAFEPFHPRQPAAGDIRRLAEPVPGPTTRAFQKLAAETGVVIVFNLLEEERGRLFDCSPVIDADGSLLGKARMLHVPDYPGFHEKSWYSPGDLGAPVFDSAVGRLGVAICYDRHFPEVTRHLGQQGAQLVLVPQAGVDGEWPDGLQEAELRVAAFHNGYFTALVNRVGREGLLSFNGGSFVCNPSGQVIARAERDEGALLCDLDLSAAVTSPAHRLFLRDRRPELYGRWFGA